ncbi:MAG: family 20 glycosylhydrolase [Planctomycetota bacterium]|nr:family 20 glycosylhydrolase [Planctomycetota bacterium]
MNLIPQPVDFAPAAGEFAVSPKTAIEMEGVAQYLADILTSAAGGRVHVRPSPAAQPGRGEILLTTDAADKALGAEGYELTVTPEAVTVRAPAAAGVFYGVQSLLQLLPPAVFAGRAVAAGTLHIPCGRIVDRPRFPWRGVMLDVSRHFYGVDFIKRCIDLCAVHKMNVFHWHLTDDGGWRMEVKALPRLTEVGAWRAAKGPGWHWPIRFPEPGEGESVYGGFYTQDQIRDVVDYARTRFVRVVPEIELPGHSLAPLDAYPALRCRGDAAKGSNVFCAGNEGTFEFLEKVLAETLSLFPGVPIHIGGDEVNKAYWKQCDLCQARMRAEGLKDLNELQSYFIRRIERFVNAHGRSIIGWDEILEGGLAPNAAVMSWRGVEGGLAAAGAGHDVVMSPVSHCYLDYCQADDPATEPLSIGNFLPLETAYAFEPIPAGLAPDKLRHVLGTQGNVWTEFIETPEYADYMTFPRLTALAEVAWSPTARRDWTDFRRRLKTHLQRLDALGVHYRKPPLPKPGACKAVYFADSARVVLEPATAKDLTLRYTLDGSDPSPSSPAYTGPIAVKASGEVRAAHFEADGSRSPVTTVKALRGAGAAGAFEQGLIAHYVEGSWPKVPDQAQVLKAPPVKVGGFDLGIRRRDIDFAIWFVGYIRIPAAGEYTFTTGSDDGSLLRIGPVTIVNNDFMQGYRERKGRAWLDAGVYPLSVGYFQGGGEFDLRVFVEGAGSPKRPIPPEMLCRNA